MRKNIKAEYQSHDKFQHLNDQMQITKLPMEEVEKKGLILNSAKKKTVWWETQPFRNVHPEPNPTSQQQQKKKWVLSLEGKCKI